MAIPDFQTIMLPLLRYLADGAERTTQETHDALAAEFGLKPEELAQRLPSGRQSVFTNRVAWSRSHLKNAGLLESPRRGVIRLSARGRATLDEQPARVDMAYLMRFAEYVAFRTPGVDGSGGATMPSAIARVVARAPEAARTPDDLMEDGYGQLRAALAADLRERIVAMAPAAFEQLVVDLLTAMGYGGPQQDAGLMCFAEIR